MEFETILAELLQALKRMDKRLSPQVVILCLLSADETLQYPLTDEETAKRVIARALELANTATPSLHFVAKVEPLLRGNLWKFPCKKRIPIRPSRDPLTCYGGIKQELEKLIGNSLSSNTMELFFPRSAVKVFYLTLTEDERREALEELVLVASGWMHVFEQSEILQDRPKGDKVEERLRRIAETVSPQCILGKYVEECLIILRRATTLDNDLAKWTIEAKNNRQGTRGEVFKVLATVGKLRQERVVVAEQQRGVDAVLSLLEEGVLEEGVLEERVVTQRGIEGGPEDIVLENKWSKLGEEKAKRLFYTYKLEEEKKGKVKEGGDDWTRLKQVLQMANLKNKRTTSTQTEISVYREMKSTQVYELKDHSTATMTEKSTQPVRMRRYLAGLRGDHGQAVHWRIL